MHRNQVSLDALEVTWLELLLLEEVGLALDLLLQLLIAGLEEVHVLSILVEIFCLIYNKRHIYHQQNRQNNHQLTKRLVEVGECL